MPDVKKSPCRIAEIHILDADGMARLGGQLSAVLAAGDVVCLRGGLGAGKTCLARGLIRSAMAEAGLEVPSPTYTLVQTYEPNSGQADFDIWHFDLYRLEAASDVWALGIEEAFDNGVCLIEWPERIEALLSGAELELRIEDHMDQGRMITLYGNESWKQRLAVIGFDNNQRIAVIGLDK